MKFKSWSSIVVPGYYGNGRKALSLIDDQDGEPIAMCTVNVIDVPCPDNCAYIKDYSENEGMIEAMIDADIILPNAIHSVPSGHVMIGMYELTEKALKLFES